jgi:hypothetical protein
MRAFVTFAALPIGATALLLVWACEPSPLPDGNGGGGGAGGAGAGGSGGAGGAGGSLSTSTTSATGTTSSGAPLGTYAYCIPSGLGAVTTCFALPLGGNNAAAVCAADTENGDTWDPVASCQSPGLTGCCEMGGSWQCFYDAADAGVEGECTSDDGIWSTTSP